MAAAVFTFCASPANAQDAQSGSSPDAAERPAQANDSTEGLNSNRGGFFGIGGQKPLQRVRGLPLPTRQGQMAANGMSQQPSAGAREGVPSFSARRTKPTVGDMTTDFPARMIYLNGKNISTVRDQELEGVNVRIDANGNVHISAPHYEVQESTHYRPLLPHEVPKVGKPAPTADAPLLPGRYSKTSPSPRNDSAPSVGSVPPVESEDAETQETPAPASSSVPSKRGSKEPADGQDAAKTAPKGI